MAKKVLPKKYHNEFHACVTSGDVDGLKNIMEDTNIDINGMFDRPNEYSKYNHYLFRAIFAANTSMEILDYFISRKVDLTLTGYNGTNVLLEMYIRKENLPILKKLIDSGVDLNHRDNDGCTYLYNLIRNYGDKSKRDGKSGEIAVEPEQFELSLQFIELLLKNGADIHVKNNDETSPMDWINHRKEEGENEESDDRLEELVNRYL